MQFGGHTYYFRVQDISDDTKEITIQDAQENVRTLTWAEFLEAVSHSERKFARFGEIASAENFVKHAGISGLGYKDGQITFGKNGKGKDVPLWGFKHTEAKEYLRVVQKGSRVSLVRMRVDKNAPLGEKSGKEVIREEKVLRGNMLTLEFLKEYLENEGFTEPYNHDPIRNPKKYHDTGELPPGAEEPQWQKRRSLFSGWANVGALIAAVKMGKEMIEHKMEEKQRLQAAEFFYNMSQTLGKEGSDWALQAMSQFAGSIGEMVDKRISKLEQLSAEPRRKEIRKILLTKPPKPFDIMAAMTVTVKMSGHLYPDSALQDLQGHNYLWFRQLCESLGYDYNTELQKAIKKEREENSTTAEHIHETTLITRFLKANSGKNPYIQAFRGGSKYWGAVVEGRNGQIEKGEREVKERAKPGDRKTYIMAKYKSNELEIVVGAFPELWGADASPQYLSPAFVWTMSNATRIAHPELLQKFKKGNVYGKGLNFHAAQFGEDNREAKMYQSAVAAIVKYLSRPGGPLAGTQALEELNSLARVRDSAPDSHRPELYEDLSKFWERYQHALHPVLQGTSPDLFLASQSALLSEEEKTAIQEYTKKMSITTAVAMEQFSKDLLKYDGYAHDSNFIFSTAPGDAHVSLALQLKKFKIETDHIAIDSDQAHLWNGSILKYLDSIRTDPVFSSNPEYRKTQFAVTHQEIMQFIARSFTTMARLDPEHWDVVVKKQVYLQDLVKRGFDLSFDNVFHGGEHNRYNVDMVYPRFLSGGISATASAQMTQSGIQSRVREAMNFGGGSWSEAANDAEIRRRA